MPNLRDFSEDEIEDFKGKVILETERYYQMYFPEVKYSGISFRFDLTGKKNGQAFFSSFLIRINLEVAMNNQEHFLSQTVPHEVAHLIDFKETGTSNHGRNWMKVMIKLGKEPDRCTSYENQIENPRTPFEYKCKGCNSIFSVSKKVHETMGHRVCRNCGSKEFELISVVNPFKSAFSLR